MAVPWHQTIIELANKSVTTQFERVKEDSVIIFDQHCRIIAILGCN